MSARVLWNAVLFRLLDGAQINLGRSAVNRHARNQGIKSQEITGRVRCLADALEAQHVLAGGELLSPQLMRCWSDIGSIQVEPLQIFAVELYLVSAVVPRVNHF